MSENKQSQTDTDDADKKAKDAKKKAVSRELDQELEDSMGTSDPPSITQP